MEAELCLSLASLFNLLGCQMSPRSLDCRQMNQQSSAPSPCWLLHPCVVGSVVFHPLF